MKTYTAKSIIEEQTRLEKIREPYEDLQNYCVKLAAPNRQLVSDWVSLDDEGQLTGKNIWDSTAFNAVETHANGIIAFYMPKAVKNWFVGQMADRRARDVKPILKWLQEYCEQLRFAIDRSNYYEMKRASILDGSVIGCSYLGIDEDIKTGRSYCSLPHPRQVWVAQDYWGITNKIHELFYKTFRQLKEEFGGQSLSDSQKQTIKSNPDQKTKLIKAVYKNYDYDEMKPPGGKNRQWLNFIVNCEIATSSEQTGKIIQEGGYNTINPIPWQLNKSTHEVYGRGIVSQFVIEIMTANEMMKHLLLGTQLKVRPPLIALDSLKPYMQVKPGGMTWVNRQLLGGTLDVRTAIGQFLKQDADISFGFEMLKHFQTLIDSRFGVPFFLMMNRLAESGGTAYKNIYQIQQMQAERAALMSPFLGTLSCQTDMELDRFADIETMAGRMPPPPPEVYQLVNTQIDIEYTGPIIQLLKQYYEKSSLYAIIGDMRELATLDPLAINNVEIDEVAQKLLRTDNAPEDTIRPIENVREMRLALAQRQEVAQTSALAAQTAKILPPMQKSPEEGSIIDLLKAAAA